MNYKVTHYPTRQRFEIELENMTAYAEYKLTDNSLDIIHTFVPPALEGRGIASALTEAAYDYAKANHLKPEGTCSYAAVWLKRHILRCSACDSGVIQSFIDTNFGTSYHSRSITYRQLIGNLLTRLRRE